MKNRIFWLCILFMYAGSSYSADDVNSANNTNYLKLFLLGEGLLLTNAYLASEEPNLYGGVAAISFPFAMLDSHTDETTQWTMLAMAESIAIYNLSIDVNEKSKSDIFKENVIAWHVFAGVSIAMGFLFEDQKVDENIAFRYQPAPSGGHMLTFNYRF